MPSKRIALVMIVRNEARSIARCLQSVRPWVDEMIVLDTGSDDDTVSIAESLGAKVHVFTWCDDFSAARNAALALSSADWNLVLDADEWIISGGETLAALRHVNEEFIGVLRLDDEAEVEGQRQVSKTWLSRILPQHVRYVGRIHEQPVSPGMSRRQLALVVGHDGYLEQHKAVKQGRNEVLLRMELARNPEDAYFNYQLGKELEIYARFAEAVTCYEKALLHTEAEANWRHDLVVRSLFSLKKAGKFERALHLAEAEMPYWQHSPDFFFAIGDVLLDWAIADPAQAEVLLPMIASSWERCLEIGDNPTLNSTVIGRGSFLAAKNLHAFHLSLGQTDQAEYFANLERELLRQRSI
ncbi:glycosyltransferase [Methylobacillus methanolivorans]|uniref:Glycosyltransferase n=1 Tax=Methylobacillus methanolivorans TaxID=1848927 RepID=A0ABW8GNA0_9PROT